MRRERTWVYVLRHFDVDMRINLHKIGISTNPHRRAKECYASLIYYEPGGRERERELHRQFDHLRHRRDDLSGSTEWFLDEDGSIQENPRRRRRDRSVDDSEGGSMSDCMVWRAGAWEPGAHDWRVLSEVFDSREAYQTGGFSRRYVHRWYCTRCRRIERTVDESTVQAQPALSVPAVVDEEAAQ
jgi:hypothetical protein